MPEIIPHRSSIGCKTSLPASTFGVELELVLAFNEDQLEYILSKYNIDAEIVRDPTEYEHGQLMTTDRSDPICSHQKRFLYPSWALHVTDEDLTSRKRLDLDMFCTRRTNGRSRLRRCIMEPLLIAKDRLDEGGLPVNAVGWAGTNTHSGTNKTQNVPFPTEASTDETVMLTKAKLDYSRWSLTNDHTLPGVLRSQLERHLTGRNVHEDAHPSWDSYGMELVSPIFELQKKQEAFTEIGRYLEAVNGDSTSLLESIWGSIHVHIGWEIETAEDMPVLSLQHLAYILVLHEDLLSKCHPRSRSGVPLAEEVIEEPKIEDFDEDEPFDPNRPWDPPRAPTKEELDQDNEKLVLQFEKEYTGAFPGAENILSNARHLHRQLARQSPRVGNREIGNAIFKQDGTIVDLAGLLQHEKAGKLYSGYMYNFANLVNVARNTTNWKSLKPTVEFRQHACSLDAAAVGHWVTLLEGNVRKAEDNAACVVEDDGGWTYAEREVGKYVACNGEVDWAYRGMGRFCTEFLGLNEDEGVYWQGRFDRYEADRPEYLQ